MKLNKILKDFLLLSLMVLFLVFADKFQMAQLNNTSINVCEETEMNNAKNNNRKDIKSLIELIKF
ncbi:MAG: hypothetical protein EHM58_17010 [Ignavibacteriae bacterium]|nr:MAG: hypothetical protein EHM58_17010 [Ignavibacteriota bacterium]